MKLKILSLIYFTILFNTAVSTTIDESNIKKIESLILSVKENKPGSFYNEFPTLDSAFLYGYKVSIFNSSEYSKLTKDSTLIKDIYFAYKQDIATKFVQIRYFALFEGNWRNLYFDKAIKINESTNDTKKSSIYFVSLRDSLNKKFHTLEIEINNLTYDNKFYDAKIIEVYPNMNVTNLITKKEQSAGTYPITDFNNMLTDEVEKHEKDTKIKNVTTTYKNKTYVLEYEHLKRNELSCFVQAELTNNSNEQYIEFTRLENLRRCFNTSNNEDNYVMLLSQVVTPYLMDTDIYLIDKNYYYLIYIINGNKFCGLLFNQDFDLNQPTELLLNKKN